MFPQEATRAAEKGRFSGGMCVFIHQSIYIFFTLIRNEEIGLFFLVNGGALCTSRDVLLACLYIPPKGAPYYQNREDKNGVEIVENTLIDILSDLKRDVEIILGGDFNARTANLKPECVIDPLIIGEFFL